MNRTGDIYMNRIALAVKSALGLAFFFGALIHGVGRSCGA